MTPSQYSLIYNALSFTIAAMGAATAFFWLSRGSVSRHYRTAVTISGLVTAIAAYHYVRIFQSWEAAYFLRFDRVTATGFPFNDAYRYVDWLLTVPLLLAELILVMRLPRDETVRRVTYLGLAAALMVVLGYPGEVATDVPTRALWGTLSTIPFIYIVWSLFRGLGDAVSRQPDEVKPLVRSARLLTFATWGFYPIVYMAPFVSNNGPAVVVAIQVGYTLADIASKIGLGLLIFAIATRRSAIDEAHGTVTSH